MEYKHEYSENHFRNLLKKYHEGFDFSFYSYLNILNAVVGGGNKDEIYDCLEELILYLNEIEIIDPPREENDLKNISLFCTLIENDDIDIQIRSTECIPIIISKCSEIGILFYNLNIIDIIYQNIKNKGKSPLIYRFFDIICSLSLLDKYILNSILQSLPTSIWTSFLRIDLIHDQFEQFIITSFENADLTYQENILLIFNDIIKEDQVIFFETIANSINQMMNYPFFSFDLFFKMNFQIFILKLLSSDNPKLKIISLQLISKSIHSSFFIDCNTIIKIKSLVQQANDIQINYYSIICLSAIMNANHDIASKYIIEEKFLCELSNYAESNDFKIKICITDFIIECLFYSSSELCISLFINDNILEFLSLLSSCDDQIVLEKFLKMMDKVVNTFQTKKALDSLKSIINTQFPLDLFLMMRDNIDLQFLPIFDQLLHVLFSNNS